MNNFRRISLRLKLLSPAALLAALVAGCAPIPDLGPKPAPRPPESIAASQSLEASATPGAWPEEAWWRDSGDPQLAALIAEGLENSPDVAAAAARFRRASGLAQQARGATLPALDAQGSASLQKQSYTNGFPKEFVPKGWQDTGQVAANLGFDLDLWGKNRAALAAATSDARAAAIDARQARLALATGIASAYVDLARLYAARDVALAELDVRTSSQKLVAARMANGLDTRGSVRQSDAQLATARGKLVAADEALALRRNQIAALIGAGPDRGLTIARPVLSDAPDRFGMRGTGLPEGVTTDLIGRRPDIAAARERVGAAARRIKVARADFYPAIRLSALFGLQSLGLDQLIDKDSTFGDVGPAVSLPLFRGGALQGAYRSQRAGYDEAVAAYDRTILAAYQDLADTVTSQRMIGQRLAEARAALAASRDAHAIALLRYNGGLSTYLDVLAVEDRMLQARAALTELEAAARGQDIALIRALGGGFNAAEAATLAKEAPHG